MPTFNSSSIQGVGLGLRCCHYNTILNTWPDIAWFEALSDNYFNDPIQLHHLLLIRERYPITLHGVGLSLGSVDPLNKKYLQKLKHLADTVKPQMISDHLSWSSVNQQYLHDLLPLPFTREAITHVSDRIKQVQDYLGQQILIENASSYLAYQQNEMPEWEFINAICETSGCGVLLDINNIYVTAANQPFTPNDYLQLIDAAHVRQYHLAGYSDEGTHLFDTHNQTIHPPVWQLYQQALQTVGVKPTLIERDDNIPEFSVLAAEVKQAEALITVTEMSHV
ncbi:MAG: DUF692 domain-containing protein [Coxiellaceae bacterium]|nr:DUF692 domain-containing protein [Coxiellaceae bacterium]